MLKFVAVNKENLTLAQEIQKKVFPKEYQNDTLQNSLNSSPEYLSQFWLVKVGKKFIGLTGIYYYPQYPKDAWLNWFGVIPEFRRKGFGRKIFNRTYAYARRLGFKNFRLYTDLKDNAATLAFYKSRGMKEERYSPNQDDFTDIVIFSKSCHPFKRKIVSWGNKYLYIQEQLLLSQNDMLNCVKKKVRLSILIFLKHPSIFLRFCRMSFFRKKS